MKWKVPNIDNIERIIFEYANGDFSNRLKISQRNDEGDVIASGINMLGEELEQKSISKNYLSNVIDAIPVKIIVFTEHLSMGFCNRRAKEFFKISEYPDMKNVFPHDFLAKIKEFISSGKTLFHFEYVLKRSKQSAYLSCNLKRVDKVQKNQFLLVVKDITNEKDAELKLLKATLYGQDLERKRLAHDLHDTLGQELNAIKLYLNAMKMMKRDSDNYSESFLEVNKMLTDSIDSVRKISFDLMPSLLDQNTLWQSVEQLVNRINQIHNQQLLFLNEDSCISLSEKKDELFVYRIIQEFINNSLKYAKAKKIAITMSKKKNVFQCVLEDDGLGFEMEHVKINGINNMIQRLRSLNAHYEFISKPGKGTRLKFKFQDLQK